MKASIDLFETVHGIQVLDDGERVYHKPASCDAMLALQAFHEGGCVAAVQAYSDKTHVNSKGLMMWPIRLALTNADLKVSTFSISTQFCRVSTSMSAQDTHNHEIA